MAHKKICHLTSAHPRYDVRIFLKECCSLASSGYQVSLIVADGKGGEVRHDVSIQDAGSSKGRMDRMCRTPQRIFKKAKLLSADVYHLHDPELLPIGLALAWHGAKVIYDAHEDVPRQILSKHWIPAVLRKMVSVGFECFENFVVKRIVGVVAATPHIAARFKPINRNTVDINNYPLPAELAPVADGVAARLRQICYVGGISRIRGIQPLIEALPQVPDVRLVLCGQFAESKFETEMRALSGWQQVDYRGQVARAGLQQIMGESVAGVVTFLPLPNHVDAQPNKMFEYMSAELPLIASDFPLWRQIVDGAGAGLCVDPESSEAIATAIRQLADDPVLVEQFGKAGREAVLTKYNWPSEAKKLVNFYKGLS